MIEDSFAGAERTNINVVANGVVIAGGRLAVGIFILRGRAAIHVGFRR